VNDKPTTFFEFINYLEEQTSVRVKNYDELIYLQQACERFGLFKSAKSIQEWRTHFSKRERQEFELDATTAQDRQGK
jgi:hypothetical protein